MASTMRRRGRAALLAAALLAAGCDLTFPWSGGTVPEGPRNLVAIADPLDIDAVELTWTPVGVQDHYELQARAPGGPWLTTIPWIPGDLVAFPARIDPTLPELAQVAFRLRGVVGEVATEWSNEAPLVRGIRAPSAFAADMGVYASTRTGPVAVTWTNASQVATDAELERSILDGAGRPTTWTPIAGVSLASGSYADHLLADGAAYAYRLRAGAGGVWSGRRETQTPTVELAAPWGLRAVVEAGGVRLTWTNQTAAVDELSVTRCFGYGTCFGPSATLTPGASTWLDVDVLPVSPVMAYQVTAARPGVYQYATTGLAQVEPFTVAGPPALAASAVALPEGEDAARDAAGRFHLAQRIYESPRIHRATAAGHDTYVLPGAMELARPGILLDGRGAPHAVYTRAVTGGGGLLLATELVHAWWDGSAWQDELLASEDVLSGSPNLLSPQFGIDGAGAAQALYVRRLPTFPQDEVVHVVRSGGATTSTVVGVTSVPDFSRWSAAFAVGADGSAGVAMIGQSAAQSANLIVLCSRTAAGAWSDEVVPTGTISFDGPWLAAGSAGDVAVAYYAGFPVDVEVLRREGGAWGPVETAVSRPGEAFGGGLRLAATPDLSRLAILAESNDLLGVHVRDAAGWRGADVLRFTSVSGSLGLGPAGAVWVLVPWGSASFGAPIPNALFDEVAP